jgi:AI-2 transport protein TqsA
VTTRDDMEDSARENGHGAFAAFQERPGARFLLLAACLVVVVAGLRAGAPILVPFALALFIAVLTLPILLWLRRKSVPGPLAVLAAVLVDVAVFGLIILLAIQSFGDFQDRYPRYRSRFRGLWATWNDALQSSPMGSLISVDLIDPGRVFDIVGSTLSGVASVLSGAFLVTLILVFILSEATIFPLKFRAISRRGGTPRRIGKIVREVQQYLTIKTLVSLATGVLIGLWAWSMNLDFPVLLGIIGFVLNYIPTIGSVIASIPAVLLALIQYSVGQAVIVAIGYAVINVIFGNFIEPSLLGRRLGLSTLVVILSLLFWYWVWGPIGAVLAVPLTMVLKIMMENTEDLRWGAVLLDKSPPAGRASPSSIAGVDVSATHLETSSMDGGQTDAA